MFWTFLMMTGLALVFAQLGPTQFWWRYSLAV
jgi:hypothetical protein